MKMELGIERRFERRYDGTYQEYKVHLLYFIDDLGNKTTKHDKTVVGGIYKEANERERSAFSEAIYVDKETGEQKRLILITSFVPNY